ncbi:MAG: helix-turn-helix transcriptional regulator [Bacteroidia bacterium]|jgi:y4mF family transcriptional regulator|tara:strand:- start:3188 stop:3418 length:231 start_codon:yes stop_codon:yes gene_type:complete
MKEKELTPLAVFVKARRKTLKINQVELSEKAGVGLRFVRDLEQGKASLRMDKVNDVLRLFGHELGPLKMDRTKLWS